MMANFDENTISFKTSIGYIKIFKQNNYISFIEIRKKYTENLIDDKILLDCKKQLSEYLVGKRKKFTCKINFNGTDFQIKVWNELKKIPYGKTFSYKNMAKKIGHPTACRAVANAIGKNPLPIIIPCHRVIGSDNKLRGYRYGNFLKKQLLEIEEKFKI